MRGLRLNIRLPWVFIIVGLFGGAVQKRRVDGTYGDEWTWLSVESNAAPDSNNTRLKSSEEKSSIEEASLSESREDVRLMYLSTWDNDERLSIRPAAEPVNNPLDD